MAGMNTLALSFVGLAALPSTSALLSLLVWVAIFAVVVAAIIALVKCTGIAIPQPVWIVLWAFIAVGLILLIARVFGMLAT